MKAEILDHTMHVLAALPTRTLNARSLHARVSASLGGAACGYDAFMAMLAQRPDLFVVSADRPPLLDAWAEPELARYEDALATTGLARGAAVTLADAPNLEATDGDPLLETLRDAHSAVTVLFRAGSEAPHDLFFDALAGLEQLRRACRT